jgi:hypothetical protein
MLDTKRDLSYSKRREEKKNDSTKGAAASHIHIVSHTMIA